MMCCKKLIHNERSNNALLDNVINNVMIAAEIALTRLNHNARHFKRSAEAQLNYKTTTTDWAWYANFMVDDILRFFKNKK